MKRWACVMALVVGTTVSLAGKPPSNPNQGSSAYLARQVIKAINDLRDKDYLVVRSAVLQLGDLGSVMMIMSAIEPLKDVLSDRNGRQDIITRSLVPYALMRIAVAQGYSRPPGRGCLGQLPSPGEIALEPVITQLHENPSDMIRAACASALGLSGYQPAIDELKQALQSDASPLVQTKACLSLVQMTNGAFSEDDCYDLAGSGIVQPQNAAKPNLAASSASPDQNLRQWWASHIMLPWPGEEVKP